MKKTIKIIGIILVALFIGLATYLGQTSLGDQTAHNALISDDKVIVEKSTELLVFKPVEKFTDQGFIFYPGGKVQSLAYAPLMRSLAEKGLTTIIVKMPFNLAVFNKNGAETAMSAQPEIKDWVIGGHSLGGSMAGDYVGENSEKFKGLVFMGAYPNKSIGNINIPVLSLIGTEDKVVNLEAFEEAKNKMPSKATTIEIIGGNHGNFGNYGMQKGDGTPLITQEEQQRITVEKIYEIFKENSGKGGIQ